ncbi:MAG: DNA polymerase III subunit delta [Muribaculaceae bacterium]|nr:DNA polymerase III subunit delta [Muribaculaceae bacterium]
MKFSEIAGHSDTISSLRALADGGKIPHALLLTGISGIGKFRVARAFAQYVHCSNRKDGDSCGVCPSCIQHQRHNNPDLHFVYPVINKEKRRISTDYIDEWKDMLDNWSYMPPEKWNDIISAGNSQPAILVAESEEIIAKASLSAFQENYKIFLIWLPEKMRPEAANKLLKIIEEPFEDTLFILVSNDDSRLLPTIFSRTQRFNMRPLSGKEISSHLAQRRGVQTNIADAASRIAEGSVARAEELACHPDEIMEFSSLFKEIMRMAYALKAAALKSLSERCAAMGREKLLRFLAYCARMVRENFIYNLSLPPLSLLTPDEEEFSVRFAPFIHEGNVEGLSSEISRAAADISRNANGKIVMFDLLLLISQWVRLPKPTALPL